MTNFHYDKFSFLPKQLYNWTNHTETTLFRYWTTNRLIPTYVSASWLGMSHTFLNFLDHGTRSVNPNEAWRPAELKSQTWELGRPEHREIWHRAWGKFESRRKSPPESENGSHFFSKCWTIFSFAQGKIPRGWAKVYRQITPKKFQKGLEETVKMPRTCCTSEIFNRNPKSIKP